MSPICVVRGVSEGRYLHKAKARHEFLVSLNTKFALSAAVWPEFQCQISAPQFDTKFGEYDRFIIGGLKIIPDHSFHLKTAHSRLDG